jgi:hypothetical protein
MIRETDRHPSSLSRCGRLKNKTAKEKKKREGRKERKRRARGKRPGALDVPHMALGSTGICAS